MGAHSKQAVAVATFVIAFVLIAAGIATGGSVLLILLGLVALAASAGVFTKIKPLEHEEN